MTTLFAALNVLNGPVRAAWKPRHRHQESFFSLITDKVIRRGSFTSVKQLVQRIVHFVEAGNTNCQPFKWTATADSIL